MSDTETVTITAADVGVLPLEGCTGKTRNLLGCACPFCQNNPQEGAVAVFSQHRTGDPTASADTAAAE